MTQPLVHGPEPGVFGAGGDEPYARALRDPSQVLRLWDVGSSTSSRPVAMQRFVGPADDVDERVLSRARGPVLDVGCGPGRMVAAAIRRGVPVLGVDVSAAAVRLARVAGLPVLRQSVFDLAPTAGRFATVLLMDGNVGIGGSPRELLVHGCTLLVPGGNVVAEVDSEPEVDRTFTGVLHAGSGGASEPFPWAEVGHAALARHGRQAGLVVVERWYDGGRSFVELELRC